MGERQLRGAVFRVLAWWRRQQQLAFVNFSRACPRAAHLDDSRSFFVCVFGAIVSSFHITHKHALNERR